MKILYHHRTQAKDAEGVHIRELVKAWRNSGNEVDVVSPPGIDIFTEEQYYKERELKNTWRKQSFNWLAKHLPQIIFEIAELCYNFIVFKKLKSIIKNNKINFIYERYAFFCWVCAYLASKYKITYILEVNEVSGIKRTRGQVFVTLASYIEKKIFNKATAIVVVSEFLKEEIKRKGISGDKIHVIPNGVDIERFDPDKTNSGYLKERLRLENKVVLGFVGNFVKWHNFGLLLEIFRSVLKESKKELILLLVGDGPMKHKLESVVHDAGIANNVVFTGNLKHCEIPYYIQVMDICIIPHSNEYRSPIKLFEYMAMNKPVVAPKVQPIEEIITDNFNGTLFCLGNKDSFINTVSNLINNANARKAIGDEARKTVLSKYLWKYNADKIIELANINN